MRSRLKDLEVNGGGRANCLLGWGWRRCSDPMAWTFPPHPHGSRSPGVFGLIWLFSRPNRFCRRPESSVLLLQFKDGAVTVPRDSLACERCSAVGLLTVYSPFPSKLGFIQ